MSHGGYIYIYVCVCVCTYSSQFYHWFGVCSSWFHARAARVHYHVRFAFCLKRNHTNSHALCFLQALHAELRPQSAGPLANPYEWAM